MKINNNPRPLVGIGIMIFKDKKILLGKRKGSHGEGEWASPGGHLELNESFMKCAKREILEESGIKIRNIKFQFLANVKKYNKHYVHIGLIADWKNGIPKVLEKDKVENWNWYSLKKLPKPLFEMTRLSIASYRSKKNYFDS